jgi:uncharacterized membrane protein
MDAPMSTSKTKALIQQWVQQQVIAPEDIPRALALADVTPSAPQWRLFLNRLLLANGCGLLLVGIIFFFAFNWQELTRFHKFALIEGLIIASLAAYHQWFNRPSAATILLASSVLVGVLLAFFGQTYQTGADTWQLFASWAALITPWVILARFASLWLLWLALINVALSLYYHIFHGFWGWGFGSEAMQMIQFILNTSALLIWEVAAKRYPWLAGRREVRLLALASGVSVTWLTLDAIFSTDQTATLMVVCYPLWLAVGYWIYRHMIADLFMLAGGCLTLIITSTAFIANLFLHHGNSESFFLLTVWVLVVSVLAMNWLKKIAQEDRHEA